MFKKGQKHQTGRGKGNKKEQEAAQGTPRPEEELHGRAGISCSAQRTHSRSDSLCSLWRTWTTARETWEKEGAE